MSSETVKLTIAERLRLSDVDKSFKWPALVFIVASVVWLLIGTVFAIIASIKLHTPEFLGDIEALTFGRIRTAHLNAVAFGWGNNIAFCVALWVMGRLCQTPLRYGWMVITAALFWNIGVAWGLHGILTGAMTSVEWLEMPPSVAPLLAVSYALIGMWGVLTFKYRQSGHVYVSQWYILAALFWFPWLYTIAQVMILWIPARGVVQPLVNWWFAHNVLGLWLTPIGVATAYYLIPKVLGKPIHSYYLSLIGFWALALFYNWAGVHHLVGGPFPAWLISSGIVGSIMMFLPVIVTAINHHLTVKGSFRQVWASPTLRFVVFGSMNYTLSSLIGSTMALRSVNVVTHFTHFTVGHAHHGLYAFFTMIMFGTIYFMLPRLLGKEWPSALMIKAHWWLSVIGVTLMAVALQIGGWIEGAEMNNGSIPFLTVVQNTIPWLISRSVSGIILGAAHLIFFVHIMWMLLYKPQTQQSAPTLLAKA